MIVITVRVGDRNVKKLSFCMLLKLGWYKFKLSVVTLDGKCNCHGNYKENFYRIYSKENKRMWPFHCKKQLSTEEDNHAGNEGQKCYKSI